VAVLKRVGVEKSDMRYYNFLIPQTLCLWQKIKGVKNYETLHNESTQDERTEGIPL
jgi:hypothetical protein